MRIRHDQAEGRTAPSKSPHYLIPSRICTFIDHVAQPLISFIQSRCPPRKDANPTVSVCRNFRAWSNLAWLASAWNSELMRWSKFATLSKCAILAWVNTQFSISSTVRVAHASFAFVDKIRHRCSRKIAAALQPSCRQIFSTTLIQYYTISRRFLHYLRWAFAETVIFLAEDGLVNDRIGTSTLVGVPHTQHRLATRWARPILGFSTVRIR